MISEFIGIYSRSFKGSTLCGWHFGYLLLLQYCNNIVMYSWKMSFLLIFHNNNVVATMLIRCWVQFPRLPAVLAHHNRDYASRLQHYWQCIYHGFTMNALPACISPWMHCRNDCIVTMIPLSDHCHNEIVVETPWPQCIHCRTVATMRSQRLPFF